MEIEPQTTQSRNPILNSFQAPVPPPSSKGHRPWKKQKRRPASAQRRTASLKITLDQKQKRREQREALMRVVKAAKEADAAAKESERKRLAEKKKQKEANILRGTQQVVITNPEKIAKMSKKQYLKYVAKKNTSN